MIKRQLESKLRQWASHYPVITVTGPRQSGKTTLCRALFADKPYFSLEDLDNREFARLDPRGFLAEIPDGAVLDEIQYVPELISYIQTLVDEVQRPGMFILTGSRQFEMMETVSQSLAGRTAVARLLPFSFGELYPQGAGSEDLSVNQMLYAGFYPRIHDKQLNPSEALSFYLSTYLERDVRQILAVSDLDRFGTFIRLCAGRTGQLLNMQSIGGECGVTHNTVKSWLSVLQASGIIKLLRPWYANLGKRLVKSPKLYFLDTGLACFLLGIHKPEHLVGHPLRGAIFETFVVSEAYKQHYHSGLAEQLWFYRDSHGNEVDLLAGSETDLSAWEVKSSMTVSVNFFKGLTKLGEIMPGLKNRSIVYCGDKKMTRQGVNIVPWKRIDDIFIS
ncbi:MAG: ATP-binding protein [Deltaproteobacteria bacterium]|nr:ATP-binding protein [Deltaproteobacteria bacterium]